MRGEDRTSGALFSYVDVEARIGANGPGEPPPPGRNREADFRKTKRSNATHASTTDKDARLYRKGAGQETCLYLLAQTTTAFAPGSPSQVAPVVPTMCKAPIPSTQ